MVRQLVKEKENSEFKRVKLRLKIDLVSYPRAEGLVNRIKQKKKKLNKYAEIGLPTKIRYRIVCEHIFTELCQYILWNRRAMVSRLQLYLYIKLAKYSNRLTLLVHLVTLCVVDSQRQIAGILAVVAKIIKQAEVEKYWNGSERYLITGQETT